MLLSKVSPLFGGLLYVELGHAHPPEYPYPPLGITMEKNFQQRHAKQQCGNLINRPHRNPYLCN